MVEWLMYPAELGREPDEIQLEHTEPIGAQDSTTVVYVWKFRNKGEKWYAGVSGPHELLEAPKPLDGHLTFSRFDAWEAASPAVHLERCTGTASKFLGASEAEE